jgi:hypothetical protein
MGRLLPQQVELTLEALVVKSRVHDWVKDDERLLDGRLLRLGRWSENRVVDRDKTPAKDLESVLLSNRLEDRLLLENMRFLWTKENISDGILALCREGDVETSSLLLHEGVRHTCHNTCTITIAWVCTSSTTMSLTKRWIETMKYEIVSRLDR